MELISCVRKTLIMRKENIQLVLQRDLKREKEDEEDCDW